MHSRQYGAPRPETRKELQVCAMHRERNLRIKCIINHLINLYYNVSNKLQPTFINLIEKPRAE